MDASIKAEIRALSQQKDGVEREIAERMARLDAPGQPGMDGPLVDREVRPPRRGRAGGVGAGARPTTERLACAGAARSAVGPGAGAGVLRSGGGAHPRAAGPPAGRPAHRLAHALPPAARRPRASPAPTSTCTRSASTATA
jgi:hypothetical protein